MTDLASTYVKYGAIKGFYSEVLTSEEGHVIIKFSGKSVWNAFQYEAGKHCVQRVPLTERGGRRQTSMISVAVLPLFPEGRVEQLREQDLEVIFQTGKQKAGGQNVNRIKSACRMKHKPTGLSVFINGRDQGQNRKEALRILTARVNQMKRDKELNIYSNNRKQQLGNGGRGDKTRTYNFIRQEVVDHRLNTQTTNIKEVMRGNLSILFEAK